MKLEVGEIYYIKDVEDWKYLLKNEFRHVIEDVVVNSYIYRFNSCDRFCIRVSKNKGKLRFLYDEYNYYASVGLRITEYIRNDFVVELL